ncbi:MAG: hypothetical protein KF785_08275 [Gemmatimonadales bacterium]|nr:hypothetical protein [Gemmatimonadales bacterium]
MEGRGRLKFAEFVLDRDATGLCRARVVLSWPTSTPFVGEAAGLSSPAGEMRCAAQACLAAISRAMPEAVFELVGVKAVRAFDATVVIASLATQGRMDGPRVVGSALVQEDSPRGAALAVLNATNRLIGSSSELRH